MNGPLLRASVEQRDTDRDLREDLEKFWNVESVSAARNNIVDQFENDIVHDKTRYITKGLFIWKPGWPA